MSRPLSEEDCEWLRRSCEASGVPEKITDPEVVLRAAEVLRPASAGERRAAA